VKKIIPVLSLASSLLIYACAPVQISGNNATSMGQVATLEKGASKKGDVYNSLGQPDDVITRAGGDIWMYYEVRVRDSAANYIPLANMVVGGKNYDLTQTTVIFSPNGLYSEILSDTKTKFSSMYQGLGASTNPYTYQSTSRVEREMKKIGKPFDANKILPTEQLEVFGVM